MAPGWAKMGGVARAKPHDPLWSVATTDVGKPWRGQKDREAHSFADGFEARAAYT